MEKELLIVDIEKNKKKHLQLYQSIGEYKRIKNEIKEFQEKEKKLKETIKNCGYKQIIFKNNNDVETIKIDTVESNITKLDEKKLQLLLLERLNIHFNHDDSEKVKQLIGKIIIQATNDAKTISTRKQVRIGFNNGK